MGDLAQKVTAALSGNNTPAPKPDKKTDTEKAIWDFLYKKIGNAYGAAGLMGNLYAESALSPTNLQGTYETKLKMTDKQYTDGVDKGTYTNFVHDSAGYGLAQWTYWSRKETLLKYAQETKRSIGDLQMQLDFLWKELQDYGSVLSVLKTAKSVKEASDVVITKYEKPVNQSDENKVRRASFGQKYYDKYIVKCPYTEPTNDIESGSKGNGVKWIQWYLNKAGEKLSVDGEFGALTKAAVLRFQKKQKLAVDGVVGVKTRTALKKLVK